MIKHLDSIKCFFIFIRQGTVLCLTFIRRDGSLSYSCVIILGLNNALGSKTESHPLIYY